MAADPLFWRRVGEVAGLRRGGDLPFLLWPLAWSAWWSTAGHPEPWRLAALVMAVLLARSAAWSALLPNAGFTAVWAQRRLLVLFFSFGAVCFALPTGKAGWLVPLSLLLAAAWFHLRHRSYLSDPLLAAALMLPPLAVWFAQTGALTRSAGLLSLAVALWVTAALITAPVQPGTAALAPLMEPYRAAGAALLRGAALVALWLAGRQAAPDLWFPAGLAAALLLTIARWKGAQRLPPIPAWGWETAWGGAIFLGLVAGLGGQGV